MLICFYVFIIFKLDLTKPSAVSLECFDDHSRSRHTIDLVKFWVFIPESHVDALGIINLNLDAIHLSTQILNSVIVNIKLLERETI